MTRANHHIRDDRSGRTARPAFSGIANLPVLLSLLFVLQFVPFEHIPCVFGHTPVEMAMDCHGGMTDGVRVMPADGSGWISCCGESSPTVFTLPARDSKRVESESIVLSLAQSPAAGYPSLPGVGAEVPILPPPIIRSIDRPVMFSSFLI
ncbi:MAG TPA: hypothetical protein VMO47_00035 [Rhodothermales bacterium]|nr:hypothetical protein [Rhodothermales bacterium]